jgi:glycosyltransferase involved in cell wall biosynthesis
MKQADQPRSSTPIKKVLFVAGVEEASLRYRVYLPAEALASAGIATEVCFYSDPLLEKRALDCDLIVLHRVRGVRRILKLIDDARQRNQRVLFDVDDLIFDPDSVPVIPWLHTVTEDQAETIQRNSFQYKLAMQACDGVIASTQPLCEKVKALLNIPAIHFPNGIGRHLLRLSDFALSQKRAQKRTRLGYLSGTLTHQADWQMIEPTIVDLLGKWPELELWLVGQVELTSALRRFGDRAQLLPLLPWQHLPELTCQLDVNLAPLAPGVFNETKSAIKWLEAALVEVPTVASSIQPYVEVIEHGSNGMKAGSVEEWRASLEQLITDVDFRHQLGAQARIDAVESFSPEQQTRRYLEVVEWASNLSPGSSVTYQDVHDETPMAHALEPFELTLFLSRLYPTQPTSVLSTEKPLEFLLPSGGASRIRLDLLFATYGQTGSDTRVTIRDPHDKTVLATATAPAAEIAEDSWAAFNFELSRSCEMLQVDVTLESANNTQREALWITFGGSYRIGEKVYAGSPCVKLWVYEEPGTLVKLPDVPQTNVGFFNVMLARARFAYYTWTVQGSRSLWQRIQRSATRKTPRSRVHSSTIE